MIDNRADSIIYQSQVYYSNLVDNLTINKRLGKALDSKWEKADRILSLLEAWLYVDNLTDAQDITDANYILNCLIILCELNQYPVGSPLTPEPVPAVLVGIPGTPGEPGAVGPQGPAGLATDFQVSLVSVPTIVDSFLIEDAKGARWDYAIIKSTGEQRSGSVIGTWNETGTAIEFNDNSTADIIGVTDLEFTVGFTAGSIQLIAVPSSGQWSIVGSRYFIPNNGNGSGPISNVLANGTVYIGNDSNQAQSRTITGILSITNTGVTSLNNGVIQDVNINNTAGITLSKLAALNPNIVPITNGSGFLVNSTLSPTTLGYVDIASSLTGILNTKITDPTTAIGDIIIRNASNVIARLGIGSNGQALTVSGGVPTWQNVGGVSGLTTNYIPKANSSTTLVNSVISESPGGNIIIAGTLEVQGGIRTNSTKPYLKTIQVDIGPWNMYAAGGGVSTKDVTHGLVFSKIRGIVDVYILNDSGNTGYSLTRTGSGGLTAGSTAITDATIQRLVRVGSVLFDSSSFQSSIINRGWITFLYEA